MPGPISGKRVVAMRSPSAIPPDTTTSLPTRASSTTGRGSSRPSTTAYTVSPPTSAVSGRRAAPRYTRSGDANFDEGTGPKRHPRRLLLDPRKDPHPGRSPHRPRHPPAGLPRGRGSCGCPRATSPRPGGREDPPLRRRDDHNPRRSAESGCPDAPDPTGAQRGRSHPTACRAPQIHPSGSHRRARQAACSQDRAGPAPPPPRSARSPLPAARYAPASPQPDVPSPPPPAHAHCDAPEHRPPPSAPPSPWPTGRGAGRAPAPQAQAASAPRPDRPPRPQARFWSPQAVPGPPPETPRLPSPQRDTRTGRSPAEARPPAPCRRSRSFRPPPPRGLPPAPAAPRRAAPPPRRRRKWRAERRQSARSLRQSAVPARAAPCARSRASSPADSRRQAPRKPASAAEARSSTSENAGGQTTVASPYSSTLPVVMGGLVPLPSRGDNRGPTNEW